MKKFIMILLAVTIAYSSFGQADKIPGFRDIEWGSKLDSTYLDGAKVVFESAKTPKDPRAYVIKGDKMSIGNAVLSNVYYTFNEEGRFYKVTAIGSKKGLTDINFILRHKFGDALSTTSEGGVRMKEWAIGKVRFTLLNPNDSSDFTLLIISDWNAIEAYRKNTSVKDF